MTSSASMLKNTTGRRRSSQFGSAAGGKRSGAMAWDSPDSRDSDTGDPSNGWGDRCNRGCWGWEASAHAEALSALNSLPAKNMA